jgi:hypothetical protein
MKKRTNGEDMQLCRLMVIIQDDEVSLLHKSVKDFLIGPGNRHFICEPTAYTSFAYRCVDYLMSQFGLDSK